MRNGTIWLGSLVVLVFMTVSCGAQTEGKVDELQRPAKSAVQSKSNVQSIVQSDAANQDEGWKVDVGDSIPAIAFTDSSGETRNLTEFKGKPVVLLFWGTT